MAFDSFDIKSNHFMCWCVRFIHSLCSCSTLRNSITFLTNTQYACVFHSCIACRSWPTPRPNIFWPASLSPYTFFGIFCLLSTAPLCNFGSLDDDRQWWPTTPDLITPFPPIQCRTVTLCSPVLPLADLCLSWWKIRNRLDWDFVTTLAKTGQRWGFKMQSIGSFLSQQTAVICVDKAAKPSIFPPVR